MKRLVKFAKVAIGGLVISLLLGANVFLLGATAFVFVHVGKDVHMLEIQEKALEAVSQHLLEVQQRNVLLESYIKSLGAPVNPHKTTEKSNDT